VVQPGRDDSDFSDDISDSDVVEIDRPEPLPESAWDRAEAISELEEELWRDLEDDRNAESTTQF
jgi:hypothetical protein